MRKRARTDSNHSEIVTELRKAGCSVQSLASLGSGVPDALVARAGKMFLLEIKDGSKPPSAQRLTYDESIWGLKWRAPVHIVHSVEEAMQAVGLLNRAVDSVSATPH